MSRTTRKQKSLLTEENKISLKSVSKFNSSKKTGEKQKEKK
jgi:hypothetical protein